ncbi:MAG: VOC family protein [Planctomycetota bacterium]|jgi:catechol 2,3-dioxygenase-like lactoylglutathione lyase family enzyme
MNFGSQITFCYVPDLEAASRFYGELLGLPLALDQGSCRIYRVAGRGYLGFCEREVEPQTESVLLTLVTDDVEEWHERLVAAGVTVDQPPRSNAEYRITHAFYRDPAGYRLEIQRFDDPNWDSAPGQVGR